MDLIIYDSISVKIALKRLFQSLVCVWIANNASPVAALCFAHTLDQGACGILTLKAGKVKVNGIN
jgi:hypothetical protein